MSSIVLSTAVRQNLLSLQSTAALLATTQEHLATGLKVNSALDNPINFFTASGLTNRANDIGNLLDSIGNGVQVIQAANSGITSISSLVDTAKSIANQVLQTPVGFSTKASVTTTAPTAATVGTATDLTNGGANSLATTFTFKTATGSQTITLGTVSTTNETNTLAGLNSLLTADGIQLTASFNATGTAAGSVTFTSTNDGAGQTITDTGTAPTASDAVDISATGVITGNAVTPQVADPASQSTRTSLLNQFNQVLTQIKNTALDSSFNGVNLLNGDTLKLVFDETGKATTTIAGVTFDPNGLGLTTLVQGTDFIDNVSTNKVLAALNNASTTLRSQASAFGSNLSVVQIRQDFNKSLINVLQTGASNLTQADPNEEAANSQALSTRSQIATSAIALANQSQANVLQLLR